MELIFNFSNGIKATVDISEDIAKKVLIGLLGSECVEKCTTVTERKNNVPPSDLICAYIINKQKYSYDLKEIIGYVISRGYHYGTNSNKPYWENAIRSKCDRIRNRIAMAEGGEWIKSKNGLDKYITYTFKSK